MNWMTRLSALSLALMMMAMVACDKGEKSSDSKTPTTSTEVKSTATPAPAETPAPIVEENITGIIDDAGDAIIEDDVDVITPSTETTSTDVTTSETPY